jgi:hypothetical protein
MINWFKAPPETIHKVKEVLDYRMDKHDCLALCGRRKLTNETYEEKPESNICSKCLEMLLIL